MNVYRFLLMALGAGAAVYVLLGVEPDAEGHEVQVVAMMPANPTPSGTETETPQRQVAVIEHPLSKVPESETQDEVKVVTPRPGVGAEETEVSTINPMQGQATPFDRGSSRRTMKSMVDSLRNLKPGSEEFNSIKNDLYNTLNAYIEDMEAVDPQGIDEAFMEDMGSMLDSDVEAAHWAAMWALGNVAYRGQRLIPSDDQMSRIITLAGHGTASERPVAVEALDRLRDLRACPLLLEVAGGTDPELASQARRALGNLMSAYPVEGAGVDVNLWWEKLPLELRSPSPQQKPVGHPFWRQRKW
ncbi:MAG: HEAT repeat domain-containing protein [Planctomycetota bacterium]